jgi:hypothetical protein
MSPFDINQITPGAKEKRGEIVKSYLFSIDL